MSHSTPNVQTLRTFPHSTVSDLAEKNSRSFIHFLIGIVPNISSLLPIVLSQKDVLGGRFVNCVYKVDFPFSTFIKQQTRSNSNNPPTHTHTHKHTNTCTHTHSHTQTHTNIQNHTHTHSKQNSLV